MATDSQASLLMYLYSTLTADATLKAAMGGTVRLMPVWATPDSEFPYLVHRIDNRAGQIFPENNSVYYLDIWSDSPPPNVDITEVTTIRKRIIELLDQLQFNTTDVKNCKLSLQTDGFIPETTPGIWHYAMMFSLSIWRQSETVVIIGR